MDRMKKHDQSVQGVPADRPGQYTPEQRRIDEARKAGDGPPAWAQMPDDQWGAGADTAPSDEPPAYQHPANQVVDNMPTSKSGKRSTAQKVDERRYDYGSAPYTHPVPGADGDEVPGEQPRDPNNRDKATRQRFWKEGDSEAEPGS
jgi:hypothetical protein